MSVSEVKFSDIVIDKRFEAEFYHPTRMKAIELLKNSKFKITLLEEIATIRRKSINPQDFYDKLFMYVELKNVFFGGFGTIFTRVPGKELDSTKLFFEKNDILFSKIRTYLNKVVLVPDHIEEGICSTEFVVLKVNKTVFDPYALWIYLISDYAYNQVRYIGIGSTRPRANASDILNIRVPLFSKEIQYEIREMTKKAFEKLLLAEQKHHFAEKKLYETLEINKKAIKKLACEKTYETSFSQVNEVSRFDVEYYHPKFLGIIELLKKTPFELKPLREVAQIKHKKINPREGSYKNKKVKYIEIGSLDTTFGEIVDFKVDSGWKLPSGSKYMVKENDIVYSKVRPYRKGIGFVTKEFEGSMVTQGFTVIRCKDKDIIPEYLFFYLRTDIGNLQAIRNMSGSAYPTIRDEDVGEILIPIIQKDKQQEITNLVRKYFTLRNEAKESINMAIRKVQELIYPKTANKHY